jgi:tetratricopeptide (TPR) repeat protein
MLTNKKQRRHFLLAALLGVALSWMTGCTPPGPRALLEGRRLIEQGDYAGAVEQLKLATSLMQTNALAWNYLGLACHHANLPNDAFAAYQRALKLDHDLVWVHYNLGCLLLEQNRPDGARDELTAFVLHEGKSRDGWLKLGTAQLRLGDLSSSEKSFNEALRLGPQDPVALNDLGIIQLQRRRPRDAIAYFSAALKQQPDYAPGLLNLAVVSQSLPNGRPLALQHYQEYLALNPRPANWDAVKVLAHQLEQELNPSALARPAAGFAAAAPAPTPAPTRSPPANTSSTSRPELAMSPRVAGFSSPRTSTPPEYASVPETTHVSGSFIITPANDMPGPPQNLRAPDTASDTDLQAEPAGATAASSNSSHRGFLQRLNPANLFRPHEPTGETATPLPATIAPQNDQATSRFIPVSPDSASRTPPPPPRPVSFPRYSYLSPARPPTGNRTEAQRFFTQGLEAQLEERYSDAVAAYRSATQADPGFFEAQFNLGLAAYNSGDLPLSLSAYETALAISPGSFNARFNFALALKKGGYLTDAARELESVLIINRDESAAHLAAAHLKLASLYSEQFHQPRAARPHYLKVLELDPNNSQGTAIRYWLQANP